VQPPDAVGAGLAPGDVDRSPRGIDAGDHQAPLRQQAGQRAGTTADVDDDHGTELGGHREVGLEIAAVGVQRVVEFRKPGFTEQRIGHGTDPTAGT
jgi:hypothetical protein